MSDEYVKPDSGNFKLSYRVYKVSSQDMNYPVTELLISDINQTRGWQSQRFCEYPQEIILEFPCKVSLKHIQILCHTSKIPSKVKLYTMDGADELDYDSEQEVQQDVSLPVSSSKVDDGQAKARDDQGGGTASPDHAEAKDKAGKLSTRLGLVSSRCRRQ